MKKSPALIQFTPSILQSIDAYAKQNGISRNASVNIACSQLVNECDTLRQEVEKLRTLVIKVSMAKGGFEL